MNGYFSIMGGLSWCRGAIKENIPAHSNRAELTCGRGELVWMLRPPKGRETLNDKDELLIRMHRIVQHLDPQLISSLRGKNWVIGRERFNTYRTGGIPVDDAEFLHRMLFLFAGGKRGDEVFKDVFWETRSGRDLSSCVETMVRASRRFRNIEFTNLDAIDCLSSHYLCPNTFVFIDPPYPSRERYYRVHDFPWKQICGMLSVARCKWMLISDATLSPRVGEGKRLGRKDVLHYIRGAHASLMSLEKNNYAIHIKEPFRMNQQFKNRLNFHGKQKDYVIIANYPLKRVATQPYLPGMAPPDAEPLAIGTFGQE